MTELRPCPFCGCNDVHVHITKTVAGVEVGSKIVCYGCLAVFYQAEACDIDENVEAWNRRVGDE